MTTYIAKRLLLMIPTLFGVSLVVWAIMAAAPEPPVADRVPKGEQGEGTGEGGAMSEAVKVFRAQYGLDKPSILNFYFDIDKADVLAALKSAWRPEGDEEERVRLKLRAQEQLLKWDLYAVPALVEILDEVDGGLRDQAQTWFFNAAKGIALTTGAKVDPETAVRNAVISAENRMLEIYRWKASDPAARKEAGVGGLKAWYGGAAALFPDGAPRDRVAAALGDEAALDALGDRAVPALVSLALKGDDRAAEALAARTAPMAGPEGADADTVRRDLVRAALAEALWRANSNTTQKAAGAELLDLWWNGTKDRWDYGGGRWLKTMLLETQFARYWSNLLRFDLGISSVHKRPVFELVIERLKYSLTLNFTAFVLTFLLAVPLGLLSARIHGSVSEKGLSVFVFILYSLPSFFVGTLMVRWLAQGQPDSLEWIPTGGFESADAWTMQTLTRLTDIMWHLAAPVFCLTYGGLAALSRYAKTGLLNVIRSDYVRTARAKGVSDFWVTYKHAARPGIIPVVTLLGGTLTVLIGGSVIVEWIFNIPGFGMLTIQAINNNDMNVIIGISLITAVLTMLGILLADLLYAVVDPRISFS